MTIGERLRQAMARVNLTQVEVARRAGVDPYTVNDILNDRRDPRFETVQKLVEAIGTTWGDLFDEPRTALSPADAAEARRFRGILDRLLGGSEAQSVPKEPIPQWHFRRGARRAYRVTTDAMTGDGILEGALVYVRPTVDVDAADGRIIVCKVNGTTYLRRLDLRGTQTVLQSANPRYPALRVAENDDFTLIGVVEER